MIRRIVCLDMDFREMNLRHICCYTEPLSADVFIVEGQNNIYMYDTGNGDESLNEIKSILNEYSDKPVKIIISHFHPDHMGNIDKIEKDKIYASTNTIKYMNEKDKELSEIVSDRLEITDGKLNLDIIYLPSSHAKGCIAMNINREICLLGDATYSTMKAGQIVYNRSLLSEELATLNKIDTKKFVLSHQKELFKSKESVINELKEIYKSSNKNDEYISLGK